MLSDAEIEAEVPAEWARLARSQGLSRGDLARLGTLQVRDDGFHAAPGADLRTLELVLLLNGE